MSENDYKTILAPQRPGKFRGVRDLEERWERTLSDAINAGCAGDWDFVSMQTMTVTEGGGLFSKEKTRTLTFLVFARPKPVRSAPAAPQPAPAQEAPVSAQLGPAN
jgi:hypothetical protein